VTYLAAWVLFGGLALVLLVRGRQFRRGSSFALLPTYRRTSVPAIFRNFPLVAEFFAIGVLGLLLASALLALLEPTLEAATFQSLVLLLLAILLGGLGVLFLLLHKPPARLIPAWLMADDERLGFRPPGLGLGDFFTIVVAVIFLVSAAFFVYAAVFVPEPF
jgi:hypothetical protein